MAKRIKPDTDTMVQYVELKLIYKVNIEKIGEVWKHVRFVHALYDKDDDEYEEDHKCTVLQDIVRLL